MKTRRIPALSPPALALPAIAILALASACGPKDRVIHDPEGSHVVGDASGADAARKAEELAKKRAVLEALPVLPGIEDPRPVTFPEPATFQLANGLEVLVLRDTEIPAVDVSMQIRAGEIHAPSDKPTLAAVTASALGEGTTKRTKAVVDATIDGTGGSMGSASGNEVAYVSASVLAKDLDLAMGLMAEELSLPAFGADSIKKINDQIKQGIRAAKGQPDELARVLGARLLFGDKSPYGRSFPTDAQIDAVTRDDVVAFHAKHYIPNNSILIIAGDIDPKRAKALAEKHFGKWAKGEPVAYAGGNAPSALEPGVHIIDRKASAQANIYVLVPAPKIGEPGWLEIRVADSVLSGGTLTTRLNFVLREQLGLTYGARSSHRYGFDGGWLTAGGGTKNETADQFADALIDLVFELGEKQLPERDLDRTKAMVSGRFALEAEGLGTVANRAVTSRLYGLPTDFWTRYRSEIQAIDSKRMHEVAKTVLDRKKIQIVAVGKASVLEQQLGKYGKVTVYDTNLEKIR